MFGISGGELFLIILVALLFFGSKNLPDIFKGLGKAYYEFKNATNSIKTEITNSTNSIKNEILDQSNPIAKELYEAKQALAAKEEELKKYVEQQKSEIEKDATEVKEHIPENTNTIPQVIHSELGSVARTNNKRNSQPNVEVPKTISDPSLPAQEDSN